MGFGDLGAVEAAGFEGVERAEVVDEDFAVDFRGVKFGAAFPEERGFGAGAFSEEGDVAADPVLLCAAGDGLLELHETLAARFNSAFGGPVMGLCVEGICC